MSRNNYWFPGLTNWLLFPAHYAISVSWQENRCDTIASWWRHQMETFSRHWPFVRGIHRSPVNSPYKGQWRGALMFSLICVWINDWVNTREAGDLRRYRPLCPLWRHCNVFCSCVFMAVFMGVLNRVRNHSISVAYQSNVRVEWKTCTGLIPIKSV